MRFIITRYLIVLLGLLVNVYLYSQVHVVPIGDRKIEPEQSLSQGRINAITEDNKGIMWIGTLDGLNSYDGYNIQVFRHEIGDSTSISNNTINDLYKDKKGNIWIATENGLNLVDPKTNTFKSFLESPDNVNGRNENQITAVYIDEDNTVWYSTYGAGIVKFDYEKREKEYVSLEIDSLGNACQNVKDFIIDNDGYIWYTCAIGNLYKLDVLNKTIENIKFDGVSDEIVRKTFISSMFQSSRGKIYFTTSGENYGLYYYNPTSNLIEADNSFNSKLNNDQFISCLRYLSDIKEDESGNLWISSSYRGVFKYSNDNLISYYPDYIMDNTDQEFFGGTGIKSLYFSRNGILWFGTNGYGLSSINDFNFFFNTISPNQFSNSFTTKSVRSILADEDYIWVGGYKGLVRIEKRNNKITSYLFGAAIYKIFPHPKYDNLIFVGTDGGGLLLYDKLKNRLVNKFPPITINYQLEGTNIYFINNLNDSILWIGRNIGLEKYNLSTNEFNYVKVKGDIHSNNENYLSVLSSFVDDKANSWFGTIRNGLWYYNEKEDLLEKKLLKLEGIQPQRINAISQDSKGNYIICTDIGLYYSKSFDSTFIHLSTADGLPNNYIYACIEDEEGNYWLSSNKGITNWRIKDSSFVSYSAVHGLQDDEFNTGAYYKDSDGVVYFGGINGLTYFKPKYLNDFSKEYQFVLIKILENNNKVKPCEISPDNYTLEMNEYSNNINIEFALLSYLGTKKNEYEYRIANNNTEWQELGSSNNLVIDKPNPGKQTIQIRARVVGKEWNEQQLSIEIYKPPHFWQRWIFWVMLITIIGVFVFIYVKYRVRKIRKEQHKLETIVTERTKELTKTNEDLNASNQTKDKLFSIIAHDLRNPLNSLLGFTSLLHSKSQAYSKEEINSFIEVIYNSSKNLNNLLDNLLGWSRLQMNKINSTPRNISLNDIINSNLAFMDGNIEEKKISIINKCENNLFVFADYDMVSLIVRNILANAIKFSYKGGTIELENTYKEDFIVLSFKDYGIGMDEETKTRILNSNKNISKAGTNNELGTGLGLMLCQDFIKMNNGKMLIESELKKGSVFSIYLPKAHI